MLVAFAQFLEVVEETVHLLGRPPVLSGKLLDLFLLAFQGLHQVRALRVDLLGVLVLRGLQLPEGIDHVPLQGLAQVVALQRLVPAVALENREELLELA